MSQTPSGSPPHDLGAAGSPDHVADYPAAERLGLTERLPAAAPTYDVADPYRWLEDAAAPATAAWLAGQDELVTAQRVHWAARPRLQQRITELLGAGVVTPPVWRGQRQFVLRRVAGQEHAVLLVIDAGGAERVLIDPVRVDPSGATTLDGWQPSKEGHLLAYQLSEGGREESVLRVLDVTSGEVVDGPIDRARYSPVAWLPGGQAYYYVRRLAPELVPAGEAQYHRRVWLHRLGTEPDDDDLVFGEGLDLHHYYGVSVSMDGRWLTVSAASGTAPRNDLWLADLAAGDPARPDLRVVQQGVDAQTSLYVGRDGRAYVFTDRDAPRGRLMVADPTDLAPERWRDLLAEDDEAVLDGFVVLDGAALAEPRLLATWTRHGVSEVTVHDLATGGLVGEVPMPGVGSVGGLTEHPEGGHEAWLGYTDAVTPSSVLRYDARTGETSTWARAPGSVDLPAVSAQQVSYESTDGTVVRMLLISAAEQPDRPRPTVLYGYGGFGITLTPGYSAGVLAWVEAGGVYAIAGLRGGGEEGEQWHRDGMLGSKQNVYDDFYAAADWLVDRGWTTPGQLSISGGSNGGLLVGVAVTQRPELFAAAVCSAPLLDMVRYEQFGLGATWASEYGTAADPIELAWLLGYSPYHHVQEATPYPAVLFTVFDGDTRVDPMHARKLCAALQYATSAQIHQRPVLLRREADVGHGARALSRSVELSADTLAFAAHYTGLTLG